MTGAEHAILNRQLPHARAKLAYTTLSRTPAQPLNDPVYDERRLLSLYTSADHIRLD